MGLVGLHVASGRRWLGIAAPGVVLAAALGCSLDDTPLPTNVQAPDGVQNPAGAVRVYHGSISQFSLGFNNHVLASAIITDELHEALDLGLALGGPLPPHLDLRVLPEATQTGMTSVSLVDQTYSELQKIRSQAAQGIGLLRDYAPTVPPAARGHLYALMGYSELFLAELFCSGVPLSTVDYEGDYTLARGSSTAEVLTHALALFDTALTLSADSARILNLARLGRARALLGLGRVADAAATTREVPDAYRYEAGYTPGDPSAANFAIIFASWGYSIADREGANGIPYLSSGDPRSLGNDVGPNAHGVTLFHPAKYSTDGGSPIVVASGVEARLIEAEAALQGGQTDLWLGLLNQLRRTAIVPALPDTTDPGTDAGRLDLHFRERALWLFLTGQRQGDLRRLVRQYGRPAESVYPTGPYPAQAGQYGNDVTAPIPVAERLHNPLFTGCLNRGA
jgi:starch-binding outer membrane protein, SusD/RagB family